MGLLTGITDPYGALEAWVYNAFLAPVALQIVREITGSPWRTWAAGTRVVDVGCGGGQLLANMARESAGIRVFGIDLSAGQVGRAAARLRRNRATGGVTQGSALCLPWADGAFHVVVSMGSLKHWPDRRAGLAECVRVLAPGGALMVLEFDRGSSDEEIGEFLARWRPPPPIRRALVARFRRRITGPSVDVGELRALVAGQPLVDVRVEHAPRLPMLSLRAVKDTRPV